MLVDKLRYKILANGSDITSRFKGGYVSVGQGELPTANISLDNSNNYFTGSNILHPNLPFVVSASLDYGTSWVRLFSGSVANKTMDKDPYGERSVQITANGGNTLRLLYLSPNQDVISQCNIGQVFTGSAINRVGTTWASTDGRGNYPDGLLYKTGYSLSADSIKDIFTGTVDIPNTLIFTQQSAWDAITSLAKTYGLMVFLDDRAGEVRCFKDSALSTFPSSGLTLREGRDISAISYGDECIEQYDRITVIGKSNDIFFTIGSGTREKVIKDDTVTDRSLAIQKARQMWSIYSSPRKSVTLTCVPQTASLIGRYVSASVTSMPIGVCGNVVGIRHNLNADRWDTVITMESPTRTNAKILADIKKELSEQKKSQETNKSIVMLTAERAPNSTYFAGYKNIIGIGYGSSGAVNTAELSGVVRIKPIKSTVFDSTSNHLYIYGSFDTGDKPTLIKEIALYASNDPTGSTSFTNGTFHRTYTRSGVPVVGQLIPMATFSSPYPTNVTAISSNHGESEYSWYWQKPNKATIVNGYKWTSSVGADQYTSLSNPTDSIWEGTPPPGAGYTMTSPSLNDKLFMSIDDTGYKWDTYDIARDTTISVHFAKMIEFDFGIASGAQNAVSYVSVCVQSEMYRKIYIDPDYTYEYGTVSAFRWNPSTNAWVSMSGMTNGAMCYFSSGAAGAMTNIPAWITNDGKVRIALYAHAQGGVVDPSFPTSGNRHTVDYAGCVMRATPRLVDVTEKFGVAVYDAENGRLVLEDNPLRITGIYTASFTSSGSRGGAGKNMVTYLGYDLGVGDVVVRRGIENTHFIEMRKKDGQSDEYTEISEGPLYNYLQTAGSAYVTYITYKTISIPGPQSLPVSSYTMSYNVASGRSAVVYMKNDEYSPVYRSDLMIPYQFLGRTASMIARFTSSVTSRIPEGIMKDGKNQILFVADLNLGATNSNTTTYSGVGCSSPT